MLDLRHPKTNIPETLLAAIDTRPPIAGNSMRINLLSSLGPPEHLQRGTWQPPMNDSFHVPERFGLLRLVEKTYEKE